MQVSYKYHGPLDGDPFGAYTLGKALRMQDGHDSRGPGLKEFTL